MIMNRAIIRLTLFVVALWGLPAQAEFYGMSDFDVVYTVDSDANPPQYWLEGFTFIDHNIPLEDLVLGESTGVVNVTGAGDISALDDFDLNNYAPRNGAVPPEFQTRNFGGSPTWQDTNGDGYDFFIFEVGRNDEFAVQAILVGGTFGQKVVVPRARWRPSVAGEPDINLNGNGGPNNNQQIGGIAFRITDLKDENGDPLTQESVIEGLQFTSPGMDPSCVCAVKGSAAAFNPNPSDGAVVGDARPVLTWSSGAGMVSQKVYFSESLDEVEHMAASALVAETALTVLVVWGPDTAYPAGLPSGMYYWRVVTIKADQTELPGKVWSFSVLAKSAQDPIPANGAIFVDPESDLSWTAGLGASLHYVSISTDRDAVALGANPATAINTTYDPGTLENGATYYWRVDEFDGVQMTVGDIWSFTTIPDGTGGLQAQYFSDVTDLSGTPAVTRMDAEIDFDWSQTSPDPLINREEFSVRWNGEIEIPVADTYTFTTRSNDGSRLLVNDQIVVDDWGQHTARDSSGTLELEAGSYAIVVEYMQDGGDASISVSWQSTLITKQVIPSVVLSPVVKAVLITPANGAVDVSQNPRLRWVGATADAKHDLYIGDDADAVAQATTTAAGIYRGQLDKASAVIENLDAGQTYYWRVDEVIAGDPQGPIKGNVWNFTTASYVVIDDFENYTDDDASGEAIWQTWVDGFGVADNGAQVGYLLPPYAERTIVHGGQQSAPILYDNAGAVNSSEVSLSPISPRNWTAGGVDTLALWYHGVTPPGSFEYNAEKDAYTIAATGTGIGGTADAFRFAYKQLTGDGVVTVRIDSLENTNIDAITGVMIRNTLETGSVFAMSGFRAAGQVTLRWRTTADSDLAGTILEPQHPATTVLPHWVRLTRQGNTFTAEHSLDASTWEPIGDPVTVLMAQQVFVGLAVSANVGAANPATTTSVLSMPEVTGTVGSALPFEDVIDIGMPINGPQDLYVTVEDATGSVGVVSHPDNPTAVQSAVWNEWPIDLQAIADQGVNLQNISRLIVGIGGQTDGSGTLFIDDIGLHDTDL